MSKTEIIQQIKQHKLVAVIRGETIEEATQIINGAVQGGIRIIELTYTTPYVQDVFDVIRNLDAVVGAGTVLDAETARHAILHGAKFIVSPFFCTEIAILCNRYSIPYLPGCMTIQEIVNSLEYGSDIVKLFPANNFTPGFIKSVKGPLPNVEIMPTGGIHADNMCDWLDAGAVAVGIGSDLSKAYAQGGIEAVIAVSKNYCEKLKIVAYK